MINQPTTETSLVNVTSAPVTITTTILQDPVFWADMYLSWDEYGITWNQTTDITQLTNL